MKWWTKPREFKVFVIMSILFKDAVSNSDCMASKNRITSELWTTMMWKEAVVFWFKLLSLYLVAGSVKTYEIRQFG